MPPTLALVSKGRPNAARMLALATLGLRFPRHHSIVRPDKFLNVDGLGRQHESLTPSL